MPDSSVINVVSQINPIQYRRDQIINELKDNIINILDIIDCVFDNPDAEQLISFLNHFSNADFANNNQLNLLNNYFSQVLMQTEDKYNQIMWQSKFKNIDGNKKWEKYKGCTRSAIHQTCVHERSHLLSTFFEEIYVPKSESEIKLARFKQQADDLAKSTRLYTIELIALNSSLYRDQIQLNQLMLS